MDRATTQSGAAPGNRSQTPYTNSLSDYTGTPEIPDNSRQSRDQPGREGSSRIQAPQRVPIRFLFLGSTVGSCASLLMKMSEVRAFPGEPNFCKKSLTTRKLFATIDA